MGHSLNLIPQPLEMLIQLGIFFATYFVLRLLVFKPYLALLAERRAKTVGLKERAAKARERATKLQADYDAVMKSERKKIVTWSDDERKKVADEERLIIQKARDQVAAELQSQRATIQKETEAARQTLAPLVAEYAGQIASKLMGRKVSVSPNSLPKGQPAGSEQAVPT